jgi:hypothetical protein
MENNDITIEEVKKIADEKRKTINPELAQKRLENLAKGREIRKQKLMNKSKPEAIPEPIPEPIAEPIPEPKSKKRQTSTKVKEVIPEPVPVVMNTPQRQSKSKKHQNKTEEFQSFNKLEESINNIKELINNQNINNLKEEIINAVKPKSKPKKVKMPKAPVINKTLDLTISDAQILNIINKDEKTMTKGDEKLNSFIKALQKK